MKRRTMRNMMVAGLVASVAATAVVAQGMGRADGEPGPEAGRGMMLEGGMGPGGMMPDFATLDADGDGQVRPEDLTAWAADRFAAADADGDGALSVDEMVAMIETARRAALVEMVTAQVERIDDNADGLVQSGELAERAPRPAAFFDRFDTDNDGVVTQAEFDAARAAMQARMEERGHHGWGPFGRRHEGGDRG